MSLYEAVATFFDLAQKIILVRILLSWFPNINWWNQPFKFLKDITDPILEPFRKMIPPIGGLDLSPIILLMIVFPLLETSVLNAIKYFS